MFKKLASALQKETVKEPKPRKLTTMLDGGQTEVMPQIDQSGPAFPPKKKRIMRGLK